MGNIVIIFLLAWTNVGGGDHGGDNWIIDTSHIAGYHWNVCKCHIPETLHVYVPVDLDSMWVTGGDSNWAFHDTVFKHYDSIKICADTTIIDGILDASGCHWGGPGQGGEAAWEGGGGGGGHGGKGGEGGSSPAGAGGIAHGTSNGFSWEVGGRGGVSNDSWGDIRDSVRFQHGGGIIVLITGSKFTLDGELLAEGVRSSDERFDGGGGGAGGSVVICALGSCDIHGKISAKGARGGNHLKGLASQGGGGGAGGRIKIFASTYDTTGLIYHIQGGIKGNGTGGATNGEDGNFYLTDTLPPVDTCWLCSGTGVEDKKLIGHQYLQLNLRNKVVLKGKSVRFSIKVPEGMRFEVAIYNVLGERVADVSKGQGLGEIKELSWIPTPDIKSGCYFLLLKARTCCKSFCITKKFLIF